jgi:peroxiredoxin
MKNKQRTAGIIFSGLAAVIMLFLGSSIILSNTNDNGDKRMDNNKIFNSAQETKPLSVGSKVPDVKFRTIEGKEFDLKKEIFKKPSILIFYRGGWCPYCNTQLGQIREIEDKLIAMGYQVLAISVDRPEKIKETLMKFEMKYLLLSDSGMEGSKAFGIAYKSDEKKLEENPKYKDTLEAYSGEKHHLLPVPSVFIVGTDGIIKYVYSNPDFKIRIKPGVLLEEAGKAVKKQ